MKAEGCENNPKLNSLPLHDINVSEGGVDRRPAPETEETNYIEPEPEAAREREPQPRAQSPNPSPSDNAERSQVVSREEMCKDCSQHQDMLCMQRLLLNCF